MIAKVIVNSSSFAPDKAYDYRIPDEFENKITVGSKVKISFGSHDNVTEGYVVGLKQKSTAARLKSILDVYDCVFDEKMLDVIYWLRDECVCRYIDVIKTVIPSGTINKPDEWITLTGEELNFKNEITALLKELGGEAEFNDFCSRFDKDISVELNRLIKAGIIGRIWKDRVDVKDKTVCVAQTEVEPDELSVIINDLLRGRAYVQARMLEILSSADVLSVADLVKFSGGSYSSAKSLELKGLISFKHIRVNRSTLPEVERDVKKKLTPEQEKAFSEIKKAVENNVFKSFLLHGVTGSGKTEVFLQAIEECVNSNKTALMLVPEISLTPQMVARFSARFGKRIAVLHSGLSLGERYDEWNRIRNREADIVIGARSAVFAPLDNIGIIIIDEEHESSYKSEMLPRYNTHDVARYRAKQNNCVFLTASATPKIESYYDAVRGKTQLLEIKNRVNKSILPDVNIIDMREELSNGNNSVFSQKLIEEIELNLKNGEQTILFLNRRGYSTFVSCRSCGYVAECPHCSISLTYHKFNDTLRCHYCGYTVPNYKVCPSCGSNHIRYFGGGTQKIEEEVHRLFPEASVLRMDIDTTSGKNGHSKILEKFVNEKTDILIGTQMVAKGLDFPDVTLVGVIAADTSLHIDDFRASERTFCLLEQVIGRAGRAEKKGRAIIQTYSPEHPAVTLASTHDYNVFFDSEIKMRNALNYPPFCDIIAICFTGPNDMLVNRCSKEYAKALMTYGNIGSDVRIIGPVRASVSKVKNKYRWQLLLKVKRNKKILSAISDAIAYCRKNNNYECVSIVADVNPNNIY